VKQTILLDTVTDVAWVQCAPCPASQCYSQADVLYDPTKSGFSAPIPCNSPTCRQLGPYANGCTSDNQWRYRVQYPDLLSLTLTTQIAGRDAKSFHFVGRHQTPSKELKYNITMGTRLLPKS
jgi:hypothetical protein